MTFIVHIQVYSKRFMLTCMKANPPLINRSLHSRLWCIIDLYINQKSIPIVTSFPSLPPGRLLTRFGRLFSTLQYINIKAYPQIYTINHSRQLTIEGMSFLSVRLIHDNIEMLLFFTKKAL
jgi:hypothetical protein